MKLPFVLSTALALACAACNPVNSAEVSKVEQTVLDDLKAGKTAEQIETDIVSVLCKAPAQPACVDAVIVLNDVIALLVDEKVIPAGVIPQATAMKSVEMNKLAARAGH